MRNDWNQRLAVADVWSLAVVKDFVLIGQHTCPRNAMKEIDQLYAVFKDMQKKWKIDVSQTIISCSQLKARSWAISNEGTSSSASPQSPRTWWSWVTSTLPAATSPSKAGKFCAWEPTLNFTGWSEMRKTRLFVKRHNAPTTGPCKMTARAHGDITLRLHNSCNPFVLSQDHRPRTWDDLLHCSRLSSSIQFQRELPSYRGWGPHTAKVHFFSSLACTLLTFTSFVASQALEVSDHFPVEVDLKPNHRYLLRNEL